MVWWLIFGGIAVFAIVLYALLGRMIWKKTKALFQEVERAAAELEPILERAEAAQEDDHSGRPVGPESTQPDERSRISGRAPR